MARSGVILDTNVFVAAGFNPASDSALIIEAVRDDRLRMVWNDATRREIERTIRQIPHLSWESVAVLFREEACYKGRTEPERFGYVPDPDDRKFAALSAATGVPIITQDRDLLQGRERATVPILTPGEFRRRTEGEN